LKQIIQNIANGATEVANIPCPLPEAGKALIATEISLVSSGTERMLIDFGKSNWIQKARSQPDKVKMVLNKVKTDGLINTVETVKSKLDQPLPLGYCNVGRIIDPQDTGFEVNQRVVSNGSHAETVKVAKNLIAAIPDNVSNESAAFTVIASIAMQGIRLIKPTIGEVVVVTGLGLIGLVAVQLLRANGCRVLGIDYDSAKCELAKQFGADVVDLSKGEDPIAAAQSFSKGAGVDAVLITASTKSNEVVSQSATMCRKRGRIVLVGVVGLELNRSDFYEKELTFQVSCSYGPGRYDSDYEAKGIDYPLPYVRWTEQRNFEAILDLMSSGDLDLEPLISHKFSIEDAVSAYSTLDDMSSLGILLDYNSQSSGELLKQTIELNSAKGGASKGGCVFVGAGNYASRVLMPSFSRAGAILDTVVTSEGLGSYHHGSKNGFKNASTDYQTALKGEADTVVIATRHNLHSTQVVDALNAGKHVFVEKPLALTHSEIDDIEKAYNGSDGNLKLMVGYNRRFSPHVIKIKQLLSPKSQPKVFIMTMNAGEIPNSHWTQDPLVGGGRIIGEACHYIDLMRFLAGAKITTCTAIKVKGREGDISDDKAILSLTFEDGSIGTIHYLANGGKSFPKERIEVFCDNSVLQLDNFRKLTGYGWKGFKKQNLWSQDKGQDKCAAAFIDSVKSGGESPIPINEIFEVARISVDIAEKLRS